MAGTTATPAERWHVAGTFDYLDVRQIDSLARLDGDDRNISSYGDLVLFPLRPKDETALSTIDLTNHSKHNLLFCLSLTLSPAAYEFGSHYKDVFAAVHRMADLLQKSINQAGFPTTIMFRSLGSPDLVLVAVPSNPAELRAAHSLERQARTALLSQIQPEGTSPTNWPGHACSQVEPIFAFRAKSQLYESEEFQNSEINVGMVLRFAMRVDCGHETAIINDLKESFPTVRIDSTAHHNKFLLGSAPHTIHGTFNHFSDFVRLLRDRWYDASWREANLIDTVTVLFFPEDGSTDAEKHSDFVKAWQLRNEVAVELEEIRKAFSNFGTSFLGKAPFWELMRIFNSFQSCFYRFEYLGVARDLFPFFRQLASAFSNLDLWERYLRVPAGSTDKPLNRAERFDNQITNLLYHLARAVRNRMENRSIHSDHFLATTLEHGGCKLVSTYTVVFWLCSELFRRRPEDIKSMHCDSEHFAACLCAGVAGRVVCTELFGDFRRWYVKERTDASTRVSDGRWTAPLLLLEISGASLLRPELCLVHCMHEVAELSDWIRQPRCRELRFEINKWIFREIVTAARKLHDESSGPGITDDEKRSGHAYIELQICYCLLTYCKPDFKPSEVKSADDFAEPLGQIFSEAHPVDFAGDLINSLTKGAFPTATESTNQALAGAGYKNPLPGLAKQFNNDHFFKAIRPLRHLVQELVGDIGMWCALDHLLGLKENNTRDSKQRFADLRRIYESLFSAVTDSRGTLRSRLTIEQSILHRWALQAIAVRPNDPNEVVVLDMKDYTQKMRDRKLISTPPDELEAMLKRSTSMFLQFDDKDSLVSVLRQFTAYGGSKSLGFPSLSSFPVSVEDLVHTFYEAWERDGDDRARLNLAMELWAKSQRLTVNRLLESAADCK